MSTIFTKTSSSTVARPNFLRGSIGNDLNPSVFHKLEAQVIDQNQRGAIQSFSKSAHFRMGGSDHFKHSTQQVNFKDKDNSVNMADRGDNDQRKKEMKASHFQIGKKAGDMVHPMPIPPVPAEGITVRQLTMSEAKQRLGEAHWDHGQAHPRYQSVNTSSFRQPVRKEDQDQRKKDIHELKCRIAGSTVMQNVSTEDQTKLLYQTNSLSVHKPFADYSAPDQKKIAAQKMRLSKSNFTMGASPNPYNTTSHSEHASKSPSHYSLSFRQNCSDKNTKTNFIHEQGFEKPGDQNTYGGFPSKGSQLKEQVEAKIADLKSVHFGMGKDNRQFEKISSHVIGNQAQDADDQKPVPWATMTSNFNMGIDKRGRLTDYQTRFKNTHFKESGDPADRIKNKAKLDTDSVFIGGEAKMLAPATDRSFKQNLTESKLINTYLSPFAADNIRGTHYKIGANDYVQKHTEHNSRFRRSQQDKTAAWKLSPGRIEFFKQAHFQTGSQNLQLDKFHEKTSQRQGFPDHQGPCKTTPNACTAWQIRHGSHHMGSTDPKFPTSYVTSAALQYKWIQPKTDSVPRK